MLKTPLTEPKQIEHVLNERRLLGAAKNQFCVHLEHAFQDYKHLYLLQEWIPGAALMSLKTQEAANSSSPIAFYTPDVLLRFCLLTYCCITSKFVGMLQLSCM